MKNIFNVLAEGHEVFWSFAHDEFESDKDFQTRIDAQTSADDWFNDDWAYERYEGQNVEDDIDLIQYWYDDEGEKHIIRTDSSTVSYDYYHGDFAEHNTHWGL